MILTALDDYAAACARSKLRPLCWAAHYGYRPLGDIGTPNVTPENLGHKAYAVLVPFAYCHEVTESYCVIDAQESVQLARSVFVARLSVTDDGVNMRHWRIGYEMDDHGRLDFGEARPAMAMPSAALGAVSTVASQRLSGMARFGFEEVVHASLRFLR